MRVATALLRTASTGFSSISGTCLYAAAWKTTRGRISTNSSRMRVASLQSASTAVALPKWRPSSSSRRISNSAFSPFSTQDQLARPDARDLPAELGADRAAGAGDEHRLARQVAAHAVDLHAHRLAAEHVLDAHLAHLAHEVHAAAQDLEDGGQRAHRDRPLAAGGDHLLAQLARAPTGSR